VLSGHRPNLAVSAGPQCYCFNALTDEGMRAMSSLTVFTSLELWGCSKVTDERMRAVSSLAGLTCKWHNTPKPV
jgi:hypothetical protein